MATPILHDTLNQPHVFGELPGPRSTELLARQSTRESKAGVHSALTHGLDFPAPRFSALEPKLETWRHNMSAADEGECSSCQ